MEIKLSDINILNQLLKGQYLNKAERERAEQIIFVLKINLKDYTE